LEIPYGCNLMSNSQKLVFPKIRKVRLQRFSLYNLEPNVELDISNGVFCLAGANGLGKSTFLAAVNFAITGIVPNPNREFKSVEEYYKFGAGYREAFFTGRISEQDRDAASVGVHLLVGNHLYKLTRGVFEPGELQELTVLKAGTGEVVLDSSENTPSQRSQEYQQRITKDVGLASFEQFVFLQHFVLTFDESRHLLLWDQRVLNQALYLCIGADFEKAQQADKLKRDMEKAGSLARNYSYQASNVRSRIEVIRDAMKTTLTDDKFAELGSQYALLREAQDSGRAEVEKKVAHLSDAELKWMEITAELSSLQNEYFKEFSRRTHKDYYVSHHPVISASISEKRCAVCGAEGPCIADHIQHAIDAQKCPLCASKIRNQPPSSDSIAQLQQLDRQISEAKERLKIALKTKDRVSAELKVCESTFTSASAQLDEFEAANETFLVQLRSRTDETLQNLISEMSEYLRLKKKKYSERDEKQREYLKLQRELERSYAAAEQEFVPLFRDLAVLFLGIDIDIQLYSSTSVIDPRLSLILEMRGSLRREDYQLSESQRFFLDIALRMAFSQYMSHHAGQATIFIDTPEGALDIAYESRAGQMFAKYAASGHSIIMTANINTSQLLRKLASECGVQRMTLHRMTSWTELSDVQMQEEALFEMAYGNIEAALNSGN